MIALIPARGGSKGIPRKNIQDICGHPLIAYSIAACHLCDKIDRVIVSSDDEEIINISKKYGAEAPFKRPDKYALDESIDFEFLKHFFDNIDTESVALIRPTTPLRDPSLMSDIIDSFFKNSNDITGLRTVSQIKTTPYKLLRMDGKYCKGFFEQFNGMLDYTNLPRQTFPKTFIGNGYLDVVKKDTIASGKTFGENVMGFEIPTTIDVDTPEQLMRIATAVSDNKDSLLSHLNKLNVLT
tara:strand:+ start:8567 stop:9286 length:720 start_codon:yes stop_codon:yes gene_type:complete